MLGPEAALAEARLRETIRDVRRHLTDTAVIWRAVAFSHDWQEVSPRVTKEARTRADAVRRGLQPPVGMEEPHRPHLDYTTCERRDCPGWEKAVSQKVIEVSAVEYAEQIRDCMERAWDEGRMAYLKTPPVNPYRHEQNSALDSWGRR